MTDLTASQTILAQLGGESFVVTSGATGLVASGDSLTFKPGRNWARQGPPGVCLKASAASSIRLPPENCPCCYPPIGG
jgi:hypothetical protein